jgi:hypothetical protein
LLRRVEVALQPPPQPIQASGSLSHLTDMFSDALDMSDAFLDVFLDMFSDVFSDAFSDVFSVKQLDVFLGVVLEVSGYIGRVFGRVECIFGRVGLVFRCV